MLLSRLSLNSPPRPLVGSTGVMLSLPLSISAMSLRCATDSRITCWASLNSSLRLPTWTNMKYDTITTWQNYIKIQYSRYYSPLLLDYFQFRAYGCCNIYYNHCIIWLKYINIYTTVVTIQSAEINNEIIFLRQRQISYVVFKLQAIEKKRYLWFRWTSYYSNWTTGYIYIGGILLQYSLKNVSTTMFFLFAFLNIYCMYCQRYFDIFLFIKQISLKTQNGNILTIPCW